MCYNCGCGNRDDDMGDPKNITEKTFEEAAKAWGQTPDQAKEKTFEMLKNEIEAKKKAQNKPQS